MSLNVGTSSLGSGGLRTSALSSLPTAGTYQVGLSATNAAGTGTQTLTVNILRPTTYNATLSASNAAGTGEANLAITIYA